MQRFILAALAALCVSTSALGATPAPPVAPAASASELPLSDFLKRDAFGTMKISPTGEYIAATVPLSDRTSLIILRRSDLTPTGHVTLPTKTHVVDFNWVNDKRILFSIGEKQGALDTPRPTGEIYAVNADGTGQGNALVGFRSGDGNKATHTHQQSRAIAATLIDTLRHNDNEVLVAVRDFTSFGEVDTMNVLTGRLSTVAKAPVRNAEFLDDPTGAVRFAWGEGNDRRVKTYFRADADSKWELINDEAQTERQVTPVGFSADAKTAYLQIEETDAPDGIYAFDTATRKREILYRDDNTSPSTFLRSPEDGSVYAAVYQDGKPRVEYLDPDNPYAKRLRSMQASFKDEMVIPTSYTKDGAVALYVVYSDRIPGDYYLFDRASNRASYIASNANWFKPEMLSEMRPITLKARDGMPLEGFLTIPRGSNGKNLPLVINPHGGPFGPYDVWGYNFEVQLLASRGYAVLQLNYRGSGNYGRAFQHAGYKQWGGTMQDDLTDATRWAIAQGIADAHRICIYGASYGGYAALMGVAKEPSLYRCAIGYVGVYDMPTMYHQGDIQESKAGENFLKEALGEDNLDAISPTHLASRITAPVMMAAGREDVRAPPRHTELMRDALLHAGKQVDAKIYDGQGHGFYLEADRTDLYTRMLAFLDRNIGNHGGGTPAAAPAQVDGKH
jgi:dipeptidyl aminopeptidase/acylaminoacyl peptidase